jgi:hypothetical protein
MPIYAGTNVVILNKNSSTNHESIFTFWIINS